MYLSSTCMLDEFFKFNFLQNERKFILRILDLFSTPTSLDNVKYIFFYYIIHSLSLKVHHELFKQQIQNIMNFYFTLREIKHKNIKLIIHYLLFHRI